MCPVGAARSLGGVKAPAPIPQIDDSGALQWPALTPVLAAVGPVVMTVAAVIQRTEVGTREWVFGLVTVTPWLFQAVTRWRPPVAWYRLAFSAVVLTGFGGLVLEPAEVDVIAFVPVLLLFEVAMDSP